MKQIIHPEQTSLNGLSRGLEEPELENADKLQSIDCPHCEETIEFYPDTLYWEFDGDFEFCAADCPECNKTFELCASAGTFNYDFFTA